MSGGQQLGRGSPNFCCLVPLVEFTCAQWRLTRHPGDVCHSGGAQEACATEKHNCSIWRPAAVEEEDSVSASAALHPLLDSCTLSGSSQLHLGAVCQGDVLRGALPLKLCDHSVCVQAGGKEENQVSVAGAMCPCLDMSTPSWGSQRHQGPFARVAHSRAERGPCAEVA